MRAADRRGAAGLALAVAVSAGATACAPASAYDSSSFCAALNQVRASTGEVSSLLATAAPDERRSLRNELGEDVESLREVAEDTSSFEQTEAVRQVVEAFTGFDEAVRTSGDSERPEATLPVWLTLRRVGDAARLAATQLGCPLPTPSASPTPSSTPTPSGSPSSAPTPSPSTSSSPTPSQSGSPTPGASPSPSTSGSASPSPTPSPSSSVRPGPGGTLPPGVPDWPGRIL
ncbi:hypothetical protein [Motilibacter deserti]|uniref:Uncharacterized protein n=1 Tax=Motilibacter deserti TaxID=2714956 RepID=A0ABX0GX75_9ACTN|nr:hypothetical protein [Motilibacter deserti]NHC15514.1 hypothetical protein [Motilibacter deserti]